MSIEPESGSTEPAMAPTELTAQQALEQAMAHHRAGRMQEAQALYRAILQLLGSTADAAEVLGLPAGVRARYAVALGHRGPAAAPSRRGGRKPMSELSKVDRY